jgi:flagellar hook-basal body complex protein FliE
MAIGSIAIKAYQSALQAQKGLVDKKVTESLGKTGKPEGGFGKMLGESIKNVSDLQNEKMDMVKSFASGEKENVHELMITLQKASIAMSMTSAVRNKVMDAYKELMHTTF